MERCPRCGRGIYRRNSRRIFIGFGEGPFFWGFPGWGWDWGWGHHHHHHGWW